MTQQKVHSPEKTYRRFPAVEGPYPLDTTHLFDAPLTLKFSAIVI